jgi:hypothetical protein
VLVDLVEDGFGQDDDDGIVTQLLPRQLFERFELEELIGIRDEMNFHRQTLKKQGTVISGFVDRSSRIHGPQAGAASARALGPAVVVDRSEIYTES